MTATAGGPVNPYLPNWEYIPDGEPHVFSDRLYVFGSHDRFGGRGFCLNDYVVWSTPLNDLSAWTSHGVAYRRDQDPLSRNGKRALFAPDVAQGADGRFYLYYGMDLFPAIGVAVADVPGGPYKFLGHISYRSGRRLGQDRGDIFPFDPALLVDDDGRVFLYVGLAPANFVRLSIDRRGLRHEGAYVLELDPADMCTVIDGPRLVAPGPGNGTGSGFAGHEFFEASSIRKIDGVYHFVYSSVLSHELCYATSEQPDGGFSFVGTLISNGDIGLQGRSRIEALNYTANNHGGLVKLGDTWFVFYHRHTNFSWFSRQGCAEPLVRDRDGRFLQAELTSSGLRNDVLPGTGTYPASAACILRGPKGARPLAPLWVPWHSHPYLTQSGGDREGDGDQYVANLRDGAVVGFRYLDLSGSRSLSVDASATTHAALLVSTELDGEPIAVIPVGTRTAAVQLPAGLAERSGLFFRYSGPGRGLVKSFSLS